jgi:MFS family permease
MHSPTSPSNSTPDRVVSWRTPALIALAGCVIAFISYGPRSALGNFLRPITFDNGWSRETFALALAIQTLLYGMAQPFSGALADRFGTAKVMMAGASLYALGIIMMAYATTPAMLYFANGVLIGLGLSGCSFNVVIASFGKQLPDKCRSTAFGAGTAAGSFGQFAFSPLSVYLIDHYGWAAALQTFGALLFLIVPLALLVGTHGLTSPSSATSNVTVNQTYREALAEALSHRSYILLVLGFFTCGFQLSFVTVHLPAYLNDRGLSAEIGAWTLGIIGLFNMCGAMLSGWLGGRMPKRYILSVIYLTRAAAVVFLVTMPASPIVTMIYGAITGLMWLSSVPPTSGLVLVMFGTRWLSMLFGIAFLSHQVGGFLGVWLGGVVYDHTESYDIVWWLGAAFGVLSALINLPIVEKPVPRPVPATA